MWSPVVIIITIVFVSLFIIGAIVGGIIIYRKVKSGKPPIDGGSGGTNSGWPTPNAQGVCPPSTNCNISSIYLWNYQDEAGVGLTNSPDTINTYCLTCLGDAKNNAHVYLSSDCANSPGRFQFQSDGSLLFVTNTNPPQSFNPPLYLGLRDGATTNSNLGSAYVFDSDCAPWGCDHYNFILTTNKDETCYWKWDNQTRLLRSLYSQALQQNMQYVISTYGFGNPSYNVLQFMPYPVTPTPS
jgi:hypothetical protein